ncbi:RNA polymerase sigma-70 factor, ECF subfamily [Pustulibacterium marinum]|uniref:RNA polymerase sigma-70 factor, ECF subfamily n=1 Tax=Pustulibacterium marinum TaxID=1224947 RepID=A0A1I7EUA3_9FLAO|nr:RNA polymerase sigma factor [Pustulibacterium marinum]SFU27468.1 RNA polymerase sigma-70 factor, ECF subfamily [Pustulibacterium marinum]
MSINQLIENCQKGERKAQHQLYQLFGAKLFSVCLKYSRNKAEAEDNLQDSFLVIFKKVDQFKNKGSFEGWLKRITVNTCLQKYRGQGVFDIIPNKEIKDEEVTVTDFEEESVTLDYLLDLIQQLPDRYRLVFNLYVLDGYSHKEIANMLTISEGTSKSNLSRARLILKERIETENAKKKSRSL